MMNKEPLIKAFELGVQTAWKAIEDRRPAVTLMHLEEMEKRIMAKLSEIPALVKALTVQVTKSKTEILKKIADLEALVGTDRDLTTEEAEAFAELKAEVRSVDDIGDPNA